MTIIENAVNIIAFLIACILLGLSVVICSLYLDRSNTNMRHIALMASSYFGAIILNVLAINYRIFVGGTIRLLGVIAFFIVVATGITGLLLMWNRSTKRVIEAGKLKKK